MPLATFSHSRVALFGELYCFHSDKFPDPLPHMATQILVSTVKEWSWEQTTETWGEGRTASSGACPSLSQLKVYVKLLSHIKESYFTSCSFSSSQGSHFKVPVL